MAAALQPFYHLMVAQQTVTIVGFGLTQPQLDAHHSKLAAEPATGSHNHDIGGWLCGRGCGWPSSGKTEQSVYIAGQPLATMAHSAATASLMAPPILTAGEEAAWG